MINKENQKRNILISIGKSVQFWRKVEGYDQESFSKVLKTARSYVSRVESGHTGISLSRINDIADLLGVSTFAILRGIPEKTEVNVLLELYNDLDYKITKEELENLYCARVKGRTLTRDFYINLLSILRSRVFIK